METILHKQALQDFVNHRICKVKDVAKLIGQDNSAGFNSQKYHVAVFRIPHEQWYNQKEINHRKKFRNRLFRKHFDGQIPQIASYVLGIEIRNIDHSENVQIFYGKDRLASLTFNQNGEFRFAFQNLCSLPLNTMQPLSVKADSNKTKIDLIMIDYPYYVISKSVYYTVDSEFTIPIQTHSHYMSEDPTKDEFGVGGIDEKKYCENIRMLNEQNNTEQNNNEQNNTEFWNKLISANTPENLQDIDQNFVFLNENEPDCTDKEVIDTM